MHQVYPATPYISCNMGSLGKASSMLIHQHRFPNAYEEKTSSYPPGTATGCLKVTPATLASASRCTQMHLKHLNTCSKAEHVWQGRQRSFSFCLTFSDLTELSAGPDFESQALSVVTVTQSEHLKSSKKAKIVRLWSTLMRIRRTYNRPKIERTDRSKQKAPLARRLFLCNRGGAIVPFHQA
jgi:hypothetical protein